MADPKRQQLIAAIRARLAAIKKRDGFATDLGRTIFVNETPTLGPHDPTSAIAMVIQEDEPGSQAEKIALVLPIEIQAIASADLDDPWLEVEAVLGDIKRAMELADRTVGGLVLLRFERGSTRTLDREDGRESLGAGITYRFPYYELWGAP